VSALYTQPAGSAQPSHHQHHHHHHLFPSFYPLVPYAVVLEELRLYSLRKVRHYLDDLIQACPVLKSCTFLIENVSLRVPPSNLREFSLFCACLSNKHCTSAWCTSAANVAMGKDLDIFALGAFSFYDIYTKNC
jgi:hypothetical protein